MIKLSPFAPTPFCAPAMEVNGLYFVKAPGDKFLSIYARYRGSSNWTPLHIGLPAIQTLQQVRDADRNISLGAGSYEDAHFYLRSAEGNNMTAAYYVNGDGAAIQAGNTVGYTPINLQPLGGMLFYRGLEVATKDWVQGSGLFAPISHVGAGGSAHALATASVAGFMSAADKTKLTGLTQGITVETDPTVPSFVKAITTADIANWNAKENAANKSTASGLGTSNTLFPTQNAVKTYVDNSIAANNSNYIPVTQKGAVNGVASLGADGKIPNGQLPSLAITETFVVASQAAMLALSQAGTGDIAVRTDLNKSFILTSNTPGQLSSWQELLSPTIANTDQVPEGSNNLYFTQDRARASISGGNNITYNSTTGVITNAAPNLPSNLAVGTRTTTTVAVTNSDGTGFTLPIATTTLAGLQSAADKTKLDSLLNYVLPIATGTVLGGVKVGSGLAINATTGVLSATNINMGTVTSVTAGDGMNFNTITSAGPVTLGIPSAVSLSSTNEVTENSHTHIFEPGGNEEQYISGAGTLTDFPQIPTDTDFVTTNSDQTGLDGDKQWMGDHRFYGKLTIPTIGPSTFFEIGDGDGATWTTHNTKFYGHYGLGFWNPWPVGAFPSQAVGLINFRDGWMDFKGGFRVNGSKVWHAGNLANGTSSQYIRGDGSLATFPSIPTVNDGVLTLNTSGIATGSQTFSANQASGSTFTVNVPGTNIASSAAGSTVTLTSTTGTGTSINVGVLTEVDPVWTAEKVDYLKNIPTSTNYNTANADGRAKFITETGGATPVAATTFHGLYIPQTSTSAFGSEIAFKNNAFYYRSVESAAWQPWLQVADRTWVIAQGYTTNVGTVTSVGIGNGLTGTSPITNTGTITLGTPSSVTLSTTNTVSASSHTHAITGVLSANSFVTGGTTTITNGVNADDILFSGMQYVGNGSSSPSTNIPSGDYGFILSNIAGGSGMQTFLRQVAGDDYWYRKRNGSTWDIWYQHASRQWVTAQGYTTNAGTVTSVGMTIGGAALNVTPSTITTAGTFALSWAGTAAQYVNGLGNLTTFPVVASNLTLGTRTTTTIPITNSNGTGLVLPEATTSLAGLLTASDKAKLDGLTNYTLPIATASVLGGVKIGSGINVAGDGTISSTTGTVTSVGLSAPSAFTVTGSPVTGSGTFTLTGAGTSAQYVRGDGTLATFPTIPGVNNATLTLATSGIATGSQTFTANQATAATFTVNVPGTNIASSASGSTVTLTSSTGTGTSINVGVLTEVDPVYVGDNNILFKYRGGYNGTDANTLIEGGWYDNGNSTVTGTNFPLLKAGFLSVTPYRAGAFNAVVQDFITAGLVDGNQNRKFFRASWSGTYQPWREYAFQDWVIAQDYTTNLGTVTSVTIGNGLTGTSPITNTGTITLGTPGSTTLSSTNAVTATSHTHAFTPGGTASQYITGAGTLATFPAIPTVNNGTLTINGAGIATGSQTFTANQAANATATITVPGTNIGSSAAGSTVTLTSSTGTGTSFNVGVITETDPVYTASIPNQLMFKADIPSSVDLNTYQTTGVYVQNLNTGASTGTNYPEPFAGKLEVVNRGDFTFQTYFSYRSVDRMWYRSRYQTGWSPWFLLGSVTSVGATVAGAALNVSGSPVTTAGTLAFTWGGSTGQYVNGAGGLTTFPAVPTAADYIQNQIASAQTAAFWVANDSKIVGSTSIIRKLEIGTTSTGFDNGGSVNFLGAGGGTISTIQSTFVTGNMGRTVFRNIYSSALSEVGSFTGPTFRVNNLSGTGTRMVTADASGNLGVATLPTDTITRLRGTTSGTFVSGDITLLAGANATITQSGNDITIAAANTTYTGSTSVTLSGTSFQRAALTGDVTAAANSNATTIAANAVTYAKMQQVPTGTLTGRSSAGTGNLESVSVGDGLLMDGGTLRANRIAAAATLDFPMLSGTGASASLDITVGGALPGDVVALGLPVNAGNSLLQFKAFVHAPNTVRIMAINFLNSSIDLPAESYRINVFK